MVTWCAETGHYTPPNKGYEDWVSDWLYRSPFWTTPRFFLAEQLRYTRKNHGNHEAREFRSFLKWLEVYPCKLRR